MADRDEAGRFAPGNRFWEARSSAGPKPKFKDGDQLWQSCVEYFEWAADNPLHEAKAFSYEGDVTIASLPKMRAMTIAGLCNFLDVGFSTWDEWRRSRPDLQEVITRAEAIIRQQKFEGASAGLLVPMIIARDLGLAEKSEHSGPNGGPMEMVTHDADAFTSRMARLAARSVQDEGTGEADDGDKG